jgi:hypothetical protein
VKIDSVNLGPDVRHLHLGHDEPQLLDGAGTTRVAVRHKPSGFVIPFAEQVIDRILESTRNAVVVLGCHKDERVEFGDLCGPCLGVPQFASCWHSSDLGIFIAWSRQLSLASSVFASHKTGAAHP